MLSPSDISIDPVDGDTVSERVHDILYRYAMYCTCVGLFIFTKWQEMEKSECVTCL